MELEASVKAWEPRCSFAEDPPPDIEYPILYNFSLISSSSTITINLSYSVAATMRADPEKARLEFLSNTAYYYVYSLVSTSAYLIF